MVARRAMPSSKTMERHKRAMEQKLPSKATAEIGDLVLLVTVLSLRRLISMHRTEKGAMLSESLNQSLIWASVDCDLSKR